MWWEVSEYDFEVVYKKGETNIADPLSHLVNKDVAEKGTLAGEEELVAALSEEYEVERIIGKRMVKGKPEYLLKWKGYPASQATWTPKKYMHCDQLIRKFEKELLIAQQKEEEMRKIVDMPSREELMKMQQEDKHLKEVIKNLEGEEETEDKEVAQDAQDCWIENSLLFHRGKTPENVRLAVPEALKKTIMRANHDLPLGGHLSAVRTKERIAQTYWWRNMKEDVAQHVNSCAVCNSRRCTAKEATLAAAERVGEPFERVGIDFMILTTSYQGNDHVVVVVDHASKWVEAQACKGENAESAARMIFQNIICRHGCPREVWSDRGKAFLNEMMADLAKWCGFKQKVTSGFHPQTNGLTERMNRTLQDLLSKAGQDQLKWDEYLPAAVWAYNTTKHSSTGFTPYELLYGKTARQPQDVALLPPATKKPLSDMAKTVRESVRRLQREGLMNQQQQAEKQAEQYNKKRATREIPVGSIVRWWRPKGAPGMTQKLGCPWTGPWKVIGKAGPVNYWLNNEEGKQPEAPAHINDLAVVQEEFKEAPEVLSEGGGV